MSKKLTKEIVNERIKGRDIQLIDEYIDTQTKTGFKCGNQHYWLAEPASIMRGRGCPICNGIRLTKEVVNDRIRDTGIELISEYINNETKSLFECCCGHKWLTKPAHLLSGNGCPKCSNRIPLSLEIVNARLSSKNIVMISDYITNSTRSEFKCICGHKWLTTPGNVMRSTGCPACAEYGFNPSKSAWIYILDFGSYIKYGISNNLKQRLYRYDGSYEIALSKIYEDGRVAQNWERNIKIVFGGRFVSKEIMPDGWTETLSPDKLQLLLDTIK